MDASTYELILIECCWLCLKSLFDQGSGRWWCDGEEINPLGWCGEFEEIREQG